MTDGFAGLDLPKPNENDSTWEQEAKADIKAQEDKESENPTPAPVADSPVATGDSAAPSETASTTISGDVVPLAGTDTAVPVVSVNENSPEAIHQRNVDALMSRMEEPGAKANFKMLIYGPPGGTKSSFLNIPNNLIYDQEDGLISLKSWAIQTGTPVAENIKAMPFRSFAQADFMLKLLTDRDPSMESFEVFSIDTFNDFHRKALMEVVGRAAKSSSTINPWVPVVDHHQENNERMLDFVRRIRDLDRNVILLAHSKTVEPKGKQAKTYPDFSESLANKIEAMMDVVGYMEMHEDDDGTKYPVMRVSPHQGIHAKSRIPLPSLIKNPTYAGLKQAWEDVVNA